MSNAEQIKKLKKLLKSEKSKNKKLLEQLELEKIASQVERDFNKVELQKYKNIAEEISKEYLEYIESRLPTKSVNKGEVIDLASFFN